MKRFVMVLMGTAVGMLATVQPAWAYLDPGTGSMILQVLTAGIAGVFMVGRLYWDKLKNFLPGGASRRASDRVSDEARRGKAPTDQTPL
jgi:hypothetical protein